MRESDPQIKTLTDSSACTVQRRSASDKHDDSLHIGAFSISKPTKPHTADKFLRKGQGSGGTAEIEKVVTVGTRAPCLDITIQMLISHCLQDGKHISASQAPAHRVP